MNKNFRKLALYKIASKTGLINIIKIRSNDVKKNITYRNIKESDTLTDLVKKYTNINISFKKKFLSMPPGLEREKLVFDTVVAKKPSLNMVPITINGPYGSKITYEVMSDYITIDGLRVTMSGQTAQKVANKLNMYLPTSMMSDQIWEAADTKLRPPPLSGGGYIDGKFYSGKEVVKNKINTSDSAVAYNDLIDNELKNKKSPGLIAGHMKDIIVPEGDSNKLGLYGWRGESGNAMQQNPNTGHDTSIHTEYGAGVRLVGGKVTVTKPDGTKIVTTMKQLRNNPELAVAISNTTGIKEY